VLVTGVATVLVAGVLLGTGFAQTVLAATDGLTWLGDDTRGEVIQINPTTGRPEIRLTIAPPGHRLHVAQNDTWLVITDTSTGKVTIIDPATLADTGTWYGTPDRTKVMLAGSDLYVVDRAVGTINRLNPATGTQIGPRWTAGAPLADAAVDTTATIWALDTRGTLHQLQWNNPDTGLSDVNPPRRLAGTGPATVLVPHDQGITIFAPESGQITQTGTTTGDLTIGERRLMADATREFGTALAAAEQAPRDLVPVAVPATNTVIVLAGQTIVTIDTERYDCPEPSHPAVFRDEIYVPCRNGKVVAFSRGGGYVTDIPTGNGRRPVLVLDEGRLFVNTAGAPGVGLYINTEGALVELGVIPDDLLPQEPADPPAVVLDPESPADSADDDRSDDRGNPDRTADDDPTPTVGGSGISAGPPSAPTNASATATSDGRIVVTWQHAGPADRFEVLRTNPSAVVAVVDDGDATQATVTVVPPGTTTSYIVRAYLGAQTADSRPTSAVTTKGPPSAPGGVTIEVVSDNGASLNVTVSWTQAAANGTPVTGYAVELRPSHDAAQTQPAVASARSANFTFACGTTCVNAPVFVEARVTAESASGDSPTATGTRTYGGSRPIEGDSVFGTLDSQRYEADAVCPPPTVTLACRGHFTYYSIALAPPPTWATFPGSCSLIIEGGGALARTQGLPSCGPTVVALGDGDGYSYVLSVRACDALGCATSATRSTGILLEPFYEPLCGEFPC
jgi:hypothetical protein